MNLFYHKHKSKCKMFLSSISKKYLHTVYYEPAKYKPVEYKLCFTRTSKYLLLNKFPLLFTSVFPAQICHTMQYKCTEIILNSNIQTYPNMISIPTVTVLIQPMLVLLCPIIVPPSDFIGLVGVGTRLRLAHLPNNL